MSLHRILACLAVVVLTTAKMSHAFAGAGLSFLVKGNVPSRQSSQRTFLKFSTSDAAIHLAQNIHPSIARVVPVGVRNMTFGGTAFVIDYVEQGTDSTNYLYLLTAAHVAAPGLALTVTFANHSSLPATMVKRDISSDVAVIRMERPAAISVPSLSFVNRTTNGGTPAVGTLAFSNGYPSGITGDTPAMTMGIVCGMATDADWTMNNNNSTSTSTTSTTFVVTDAAMSGGMSGGPLVSMDGSVLGMNALVRPDMRALGNYAVSAETCLLVLNKFQQETTGTTSSTGSSTTYRVMLYNDRMNKKTRVAQVLRDVAALNETTAEGVMMAAHQTGKGIIQEFEKQVQAESFCMALRQQDLLVEVETTYL